MSGKELTLLNREKTAYCKRWKLKDCEFINSLPGAEPSSVEPSSSSSGCCALAGGGGGASGSGGISEKINLIWYIICSTITLTRNSFIRMKSNRAIGRSYGIQPLTF